MWRSDVVAVIDAADGSGTLDSASAVGIARRVVEGCPPFARSLQQRRPLRWSRSKVPLL